MCGMKKRYYSSLALDNDKTLVARCSLFQRENGLLLKIIDCIYDSRRPRFRIRGHDITSFYRNNATARTISLVRLGKRDSGFSFPRDIIHSRAAPGDGLVVSPKTRTRNSDIPSAGVPWSTRVLRDCLNVGCRIIHR